MFISEGVYKNQDEIQSEFEKLKEVKPDKLSNAAFFTKGKCFFLQVEPDKSFLTRIQDEVESVTEMHPHYYWVNKAVRHHGQHLISYKLRSEDFKGPENMRILKDVLNVQSYEELNDTKYFVVNGDGMKLPVGGRITGE